MSSLILFSPAGVVPRAGVLKLASKRLRALGFEPNIDAAALKRNQRFAGADDDRLAALHRVADAAPGVAMASRGGYGLSRLLDGIDWAVMGRSIERGTRWVGHSDMTALQLGLLAHLGRTAGRSWAGPMACADFGRSDDAGGVDEITRDCFLEAMSGELEGVGFRTEAGFAGLQCRGTLWGGNLTIVNSLLGTRHWPKADVTKGGILFLEDVNEHPYRIERSLLQLQQAGVLDKQRAILLGSFTEWKKSPLDRGYSLKAMLARVRSTISTPILTGLPFGHVPTKLSLPIGAKVQLLVDGRDVLIGW
ncbi:LD-carboxypeptidase [Piscinibacter sakaiensis]|uniref:LD-carboxypeptidase n=1 Tax=Piscinibacter sakaiensis TaxID=1547922 RepID=UPI003AB0813C